MVFIQGAMPSVSVILLHKMDSPRCKPMPLRSQSAKNLRKMESTCHRRATLNLKKSYKLTYVYN